MTECSREWDSVRAVAGVAVEHEYGAPTPCPRHWKEPAVETQTIHCVECHRFDIAKAERRRRWSVSNREVHHPPLAHPEDQQQRSHKDKRQEPGRDYSASTVFHG